MAEQEITTLSLERYESDAKALIVATQALADAGRHAEVTPLHLLSQCLSGEATTREVFRRASASLTDMQAAVETALSRQPVAGQSAWLSGLLLDLMKRAEQEALRRPEDRVRVSHLLNALAQEVRGAAAEILSAFQIGPGSLRPFLLSDAPGTPEAESPTAPASPVIELYATDLVRTSGSGRHAPLVGRGAELRRLLTILERRGKHHPLLVGDTGVGKATVVRGLAQRVARGDVPRGLRRLSLLSLDLAALVAGARLRGELEGRARKLFEALEQRPRSVLVVLGLQQLHGPTSQLSGVADLLRSALERGAFRLLATTTPEGERRISERDPLFHQLLTRQPVLEPSRDEAAEMVRGAAELYERHHGIQIGEEAILMAVNLAKRYVPDRFLPDSAFDLLDEAAASTRVDVDGVPPELDVPLRRLESVRTQLAALEGADDDVTQRARKKLEAEAEKLAPEIESLRSQLERKASARALVSSLRAQLSEATTQLSEAKARGDLAAAGELDHVTLADLRSRLDRAEHSAREAGADAREPILTGQDVARTLAVWTGIPVSKMLEGETQKLQRMEERLSQRVVGHDHALAKVARAVRRSRVGLRDPKRPIGSFLFLGPSGVGKTELAKALAEFLFDDEQALTRLDMSEYMERHMAQRLLGAPPGYADSERGGLLTEAVRRRPYSVLLFDEVEKAHQDVFNLLLQVLDDGRLTDGRGRLADFTNTVVIMTSNIGSEKVLGLSAAEGDASQQLEGLQDTLLAELREFFRPEFLNRIGDIVIFGALSRSHLEKIADIQLRKVNHLLEARGLSLRVSDAAKRRLVELGYEPSLGARPLERTIVREIQDPVAEGLLSGRFSSGQSLRAELVEGAIALTVERA